jgi:hypothetical protein
MATVQKWTNSGITIQFKEKGKEKTLESLPQHMQPQPITTQRLLYVQLNSKHFSDLPTKCMH